MAVAAREPLEDWNPIGERRQLEQGSSLAYRLRLFGVPIHWLTEITEWVDGRSFTDVHVTEDMVGHKLGEFSPTRTFKGHTNKKEGTKAGR